MALAEALPKNALEQTPFVCVTAIFNGEITTVLQLLVHPAVFRTVTVYVPPVFMEIEELVEPLLQVYPA